MILKNEKDVVNKLIVPGLKELGAWYFKNESALSIRGLPDIIGCIGGRLFVIEAKYSRREYQKYHPRTALQRHVLKQVMKAGGYATFCFQENVEEVLESLARIKNQHEPRYYLVN